MSLVESLGAASQTRSATTTAMSEPLAQSQVQSAAPAVAKTELRSAVQQSTATSTTRIMLESPPKEAALPRRSLPVGTSTAAYLIEMRLSQELAQLQEDQKKE